MTLEKLQWTFGLLIVLLPTQLGLHFWPSWAVVNGIRVDYFSPTLYITDVLVLSLLLVEIFNLCALQAQKYRASRYFHFSIFNRFSKIKFSKKLLVYCFIGLLIYLNIIHSLSPAVSFYKWLKVAEFGFLVWWIAKNAELLSSYYKLLLVPVFYESVLAIWQFLSQSSVGGLWYWLGERTFYSGTPGIANAMVNGQLVLRPYGTFSHPNVLGGFLAVVLPLILACQLTGFLHNSRKLTAAGLVGSVVLVLGYLTLFLSMSRVAIVVGIVATLWVVRRKFFWVAAVTLVPILLLVPRFLAVETETEPVTARWQLDGLALTEFVRSPILGTGLGTAPLYLVSQELGIRNFALTFQPTHNIYLLALAETGVWGLLALGGLGWWAVKKRSLPLVSILVLGLADHYFLTLQQGQLLMAVALGTMIALSKWEGVKKR